MKSEPSSSSLTWVATILGLAAIYFVTGKLALLLAIPPGYATSVWPPAGIALSGLLLFGVRAWPGVFLGSFLVNVSIAVDMTSINTILRTLLLPTAISLGASLQALVGSYFVRRWVGFPPAFDHSTDFLKIIVIGGPITCLIAPTVGVLSMGLFGGLNSDELPHSWLVWWIGDIIGVLMVLPLVSVWKMELQQARLRTQVLVGLPLIVGIVLTVFVFLDVRDGEWKSAQIEFERRADIMAQTLKNSLESKVEIVHSILALFESSIKVDRDEFHSFVDPIFSRHPGLYGLSWNARVSRSQRTSYEETARQDGYSNFRITEQDEKGELVTAGDREEYVTVFYIEPYKKNEKAMGYDLASDPVRAKVLKEARDIGHVLITPPIHLVQESSHQLGFLFFAPIYKNGFPHRTVEEKRRNLHSFVSAVFHADKMVQKSLKAFEREGIDYRIVDTSIANKPGELYVSGASSPTTPTQSIDWAKVATFRSLYWSTIFPIAGRQWAIEFWPSPRYDTTELSDKPWGVLTGGLFFTSLFSAFLAVLTGRSSMIERIVVERTAELSETNVSLMNEITHRKEAEKALQTVHDHLEERIDMRTRDLAKANQELQAEAYERKKAQAAHKKMEQELLKVQKLDSIGILAGGIAHDFNNLLTAINGNLFFLKMQTNFSAKSLHIIEEMERVLSRATGLTHQLLTFAKGGAPVKNVVELSRLVRDSCSFALRGSNVKCLFRLEDLWPVNVDAGQIDQVIGNLIINGIQAMPTGGVINVAAENIHIETGDGVLLNPGQYVKLTFQDHGCGIPTKTLSKIFDPFFTTKPNGSGLGLATAYSIIRQHEGDIRVESELTVGTTFHVYLPATDTETQTQFVLGKDQLRLGSGRILVMDDEEMIRTLAEAFVTELGYAVEVASDGAEAVEKYQEALQSGQHFDAVVLDLTVPGGMGGKETVRQLREIDPKVKAIVTSGYSGDSILSQFKDYGFSAVVTKPYTIKELGETLHRIITK